MGFRRAPDSSLLEAGRIRLRTIFVLLLGLAALGYALVPFLSGTEQARSLLRQAAESYGYELTVEEFRVGYDLEVVLSRATLGEPDALPFLRFDRLVARPLVGGQSSGGQSETSPPFFRVHTILERPHVFSHRFPDSDSPSEPGDGASDGPPSSDSSQGVPVTSSRDFGEVLGGPVQSAWLTRLELEVRDATVETPGGTEQDPAQIYGPLTGRVGRGGPGHVVEVAGAMDVGAFPGRMEWRIHVDPVSWHVDANATVSGRLEQATDFSAAAGLPEEVFPAALELRARLTGDLGATSQLVLEGDFHSASNTLQVLSEGVLDMGLGSFNAETRVVLPDGLPVLSGQTKVWGIGGRGVPSIDGKLTAASFDFSEASEESLAWFGGPLAPAAGSLTAEFSLAGLLKEPRLSLHAKLAEVEGSYDGRTYAAPVLVFDLDYPGEDGAISDVDVSLRDFRGGDADKGRVVEGVYATAAISLGISSNQDGGVPPVGVKLAVTKGDVLWDVLYVDLAEHPLHAQLTAALDADDVYVVKDGVVRADGLGSLRGSGRYREAGDVDARVRVELPALAEPFRVLVREPLELDHPSLATVTLDGGVELDLAARVVGGELRRLEGDLVLDGVKVTAAESGVDPGRIDARLPFLVGEEAEKTWSREARLRVASGVLGGVLFPPIELPLRSSAASLALVEEVGIELLGGRVHVPTMQAVYDPVDGPTATMQLRLSDLDLAAVTTSFGLPEVTGTLQGDLEEVLLSSEAVRTTGVLEASAFGGVIRFGNPYVDSLGTGVSARGVDIEFHRLDLGAVTEALPLGRIQGVIEGTINDLVVVGGQPVAMEAHVETVKVSGVPQKISVGAISQISVLGGGAGDALSQRVLEFFEEYRYAKMGLRCRLKNDVFEVEGAERVDGKEFLVVGSFFPPSVNVVSHSQTISFSQMLDRLRRIGELGE